MKLIIKPALISIWAFLTTMVNLDAQTLPNSDFSSWNKTASETIYRWKIEGNVTKDTANTTNFGVALKNDTSGLTSMYQVGRRYPDSYNGGFSLNGTPTSMKISYRSDLLKTDTGLIIFGCTKSGDTLPIILQQIFLLPGQGSSSAHAQLTVNLTYSHPTAALAADSAFMVIYSSLRPKKPNNTGILILSNIQLSNSGTITENGNLTFDSWNSISVESPAQWITSQNVYYALKSNELSSFQLSSKFNDGTKNTLELKSSFVNQPNNIDTIAAWAISSSALNPTLDVLKPTFPYTLKSGAIQIDWSGTLNNGDRLTATVNLFRGDSIIGSGTFSKTGFNYNHSASIPSIENIVWLPGYTEMPEYATVKIWLSDSSFSTQATPSSVARIRKISFLPFGINIHKIKAIAPSINLFPNPCISELTINSSEKINGFNLINNRGQVVLSSNSSGANINVPINLPAGNYWMHINLSSGTVTKHLQIIR